MDAANPDETTDELSVEVGVGLVLRAADTGDWKPVVDWLIQHPEHVSYLAEFLADERKLAHLARSPAPTNVRAGSSLGEFQLQAEIGHGGMGVVYRAIDNLQREVAVKLLRGGTAYTPEEVARFRFEAEMVASLDHPNIVPILAYGEHGGTPYIIMPLLTGGSLATWLKQRTTEQPLTATEAVQIVRSIALGVQHAHQRGLIHRDLKPANILLDPAGTPHVADFGLARPLDMTASASGNIAGTLLYMAPEQARGEKYLTTAVDIHALGAILFELLTGRTPFAGGDFSSVIRRVLEEPAPAVRTFRPDTDRDLEAICLKCLSKNPSDRYPSAAALIDDLTKYLHGEPISAAPSSWLRSTLRRALGRQREMNGVVSWSSLIWGAISCVLWMALWQVAVLREWPLWVSQMAAASYLFWYLAIIGFVLMRNKEALNPLERASVAMHYGIKSASTAALIVALLVHDGDPLYVLPTFMSIIGLGIYAHGFIYWGRFYLIGASFFVVAALMPLVPMIYWPGVYGGYLGLFQLGAAHHLRRVHRTSSAR